MRAFGGRWRVIGFLTTLSSVLLPSTARIFILCSSWIINPEKRLKVRGMRRCSLTLIKTFLLVRMKISRWPALLSGLSSAASSIWCAMSGRECDGSLLSFLCRPRWSSQLRSSKDPREVLTGSRVASSITRMTLRILPCVASARPTASFFAASSVSSSLLSSSLLLRSSSPACSLPWRAFLRTTASSSLDDASALTSSVASSASSPRSALRGKPAAAAERLRELVRAMAAG
mmetsp:Transcript_20053/g.50778  ORF Transcript_20053/g.50778 Transcript_20053/m.50778 type:complete len:231 (-) Transcript_20053:60-752(-)